MDINKLEPGVFVGDGGLVFRVVSIRIDAMPESKTFGKKIYKLLEFNNSDSFPEEDEDSMAGYYSIIDLPL